MDMVTSSEEYTIPSHVIPLWRAAIIKPRFQVRGTLLVDLHYMSNLICAE